MSEKKKRVAIYLRVSTKSESQRASIKDQEQLVKDAVARHEEWEWVDDEKYIFRDKGKSGTKLLGRKDFQAAIAGLKLGEFDVLAIREPSRAARNLRDFVVTVDELEDLDKELYFIDYNLSTANPKDRTALVLLAQMAEEESRRKSMYKRTSIKFQREKGWVFGADDRYGWDLVKTPKGESNRLVINDYEARAVRMVFDLYINKNMGIRSIVGYLNDDTIDKSSLMYPEDPEHEYIGKVKTKKPNQKWSLTTVGRLLTNEGYLGKVCYGTSFTKNMKTESKKNRNKLSWEYKTSEYVDRIIEDDVFEKAKAIAASRCTLQKLPVYDEDGQTVRDAHGDVVYNTYSVSKDGVRVKIDNDANARGCNITHCMWGRKLQCGCGCGGRFSHHRVRRGRKGEQRPFEYVSRFRFADDKRTCSITSFREDLLQYMVAQIFDLIPGLDEQIQQAKREYVERFRINKSDNEKRLDHFKEEYHKVDTALERLHCILEGADEEEAKRLIKRIHERREEKAGLTKSIETLENLLSRKEGELEKSIDEELKRFMNEDTNMSLYEEVDSGYQGICPELVDEFIAKVVVNSNFDFDWYLNTNGGCGHNDYRNKFSEDYQNRYAIPDSNLVAEFEFDDNDRKAFVGESFRVRRARNENGELILNKYHFRVYIFCE